MKKLLLLLITLGTIACKNNKPETATELVKTPKGLINVPTAPVQAASQSSQNPGLNPAHGQSGHRCDIAVGAPLNSPVTPTSMPQTEMATQTSVPTPQPTVTTTLAPTQTPTVNAKGQKLNPAHGQPKHRCDLAVGAPLT